MESIPMSLFKRLLGRTPDKIAAKALREAKGRNWEDARIFALEALEGLPTDDVLRAQVETALAQANDAIAADHLDAAEAYVEAEENEKAVERAALARDMAVSKELQEQAAKMLRKLADSSKWSTAGLREHMIEADQDLAAESGENQEIEALFAAQGERAEKYRQHGEDLGQALQAAADGELTEARDILRRLQKKAPKDEVIAFELGHVLHALGDTSGAARSLRQAVNQDPRRVEAVLELAEVSLELGHRRGALDALRAYPEEDPRVTQRLCEILIALGQLDEARERLEAAVGTEAESAAVFRLLGEVHERREEYREAGRLYDLAYGKGPQDPLNALWLARFLGNHGDDDDAVRAIEIYNGLAEKDASGRFLYFRLVGELYLKLGHIDEAIEILENAKGLTPLNRAEDMRQVEKLLERAYGDEEEE
jgi:tetratricopeptide (TPR) repeat protein